MASLLAITALSPSGCNRHPTASPALDPSELAASDGGESIPPPATPRTPSMPVLSSDGQLPAAGDQVEGSGDLSATAMTSVESADGSKMPSKRSLDTTLTEEAPLEVETATGQLDGDANQAEAAAPYRLLLPTTAGPLLVDLDIDVDDQPLSDLFDQRIASIIEAAQANDDELTWERLFKYIADNPQPFGRLTIDYQQSRNMIQLYDRNRNRRADLDEVILFLFRDSGFSGPFRMVGSNSFRQINRSESPLFQAMDQNENQTLEADEIQVAYEALMRLDRNGDHRLDAAEITPPVSVVARSSNDAWNSRHTSRWGDVAMDLGGFVDWSMVSYSLEEAPRDGIFHDGPNTIAGLDQNGDDSVDQDESRGLLTIPADIRMKVHFSSNPSSQPHIEWEVLKKDEAVLVENPSQSDRARIASERFQLIAMARDLPSRVDAIPVEAFAAIDANQDGGLEESELPPGVLRDYSFEDLDADQDGKLTHRELVEGMTPTAPLWTIQVRSRGAEAPDAIFTWLDQDENGLLSTRELRGCVQRLKRLAESTGNGVRAVHFPDTFLIQFGRSDRQQEEQLFALTPTRSEGKRAWPRWAESMDINQDGDVSLEEFLGQREQFDTLDQNQDGFFSSGEIH